MQNRAKAYHEFEDSMMREIVASRQSARGGGITVGEPPRGANIRGDRRVNRPGP